MAELRLERRPDGALLLTDPGSARPAVGAAGIGAAVLLAGGVASGGAGPLEAVVVAPLALVALLGGVAALRHRDWVLLDRRARAVVHRRGLRSLFRSAATFPFDDVEAVVVDSVDGEEGARLMVGLRRAGDVPWPLAWRADAAHAMRLATALQEVGGWPLERDGVRVRPPEGVVPGRGRR